MCSVVSLTTLPEAHEFCAVEAGRISEHLFFIDVYQHPSHFINEALELTRPKIAIDAFVM